MTKYVVVGVGPVGTETARLLAEAGHDVVLASRSVSPSAIENVEAVQVDATDAKALASISKGAETIFMCAMAPYHRWPTDYFPIADGVTKAAEAVGAKQVIAGNCYCYGENAASPLRWDTPIDPTTRKGAVRTIMWQRALRSEVPAIEVRSGDYLGQNVIATFTLLVLPNLLAGKPVTFLGDIDASHAWAYTKDVARTLVAASNYRGEWNRAFHAPSQHASPREVIHKAATMLGKSVPEIGAYTIAQLAEHGMQELVEMIYLFDRPQLIDSSDAASELGIQAQSLEVMIADTVRAAGT